MRPVPLLLALLLPLVPSAVAGASPGWSVAVEVPDEAPVGLPFLVRVCAEGPSGAQAEAKVSAGDARLALDGAPLRKDRYAVALPLDEAGRACRDVALEHPGPAGEARVEAKVRPRGGEPKVSASTSLALVAASVAPWRAEGPVDALDADARALLRVPSRNGSVLLPLLDGVERFRPADAPAFDAPAPARVRIAEVRREGFVLSNEGEGPVFLGALRLAAGSRETPLPSQDLAPGGRLLLGPAPSPDGVPHAGMDVPRLRGAVRLLAGGLVLDAAEVPPFRENEAFVPGEGIVTLGATRFAATSRSVQGPLVLFATPDAGAAPVLDLLAGARREALLQGYTLTSADVAAALLAAHERGVRVRVLLEGAPVGGVPPAQKDLAGVLAREGVEVLVMEAAPGWPARYASLHAKLLVVDRASVLVGTENFHDSSYPPFARAEGTRGFGLVVHDPGLAGALADALDADAAPWPDVRRVPPAPADAPRPLPSAALLEGPTRTLEGRSNVTPLLAPDAGVEGMVTLLGSARERVDAALLFAEPRFSNRSSPFLDALLDAARRGVHVRLLLDGRLDPDRNRAVVEVLAERARAEGLPLEARLADPRRTLHAKLVLVDGERSYVGSMNWGEASALRNREAGLVLESAEAAGWFGERFEKEWKGEAPAPEREVGGPEPGWSVAGAAALTLLRARRRGSRA